MLNSIALRKKIRALLASDDITGILREIENLPPSQIINALIACLSALEQRVKWHAVSAIGTVVAKEAKREAEWARIIMRRLIWSLNDESGGIGWGAPEAMAEIMSQHAGMAAEYAHMLISYLRHDGNYLENENLRCGVLWGLARLAQIDPDTVKGATSDIISYLHSENPALRGMAAWALKFVKPGAARNSLEKLLADDTQVEIYSESRLANYRIMDLALDALNVGSLLIPSSISTGNLF